MNKKFSTLLASVLLAGGLFSTANADTFGEAKKGQYYIVKVGAAEDSRDDSFEDGALWTVKEVSVANGVKGYQLVNKETGKVFAVEDADVTYSTFAADDKQLLFVNTENGLNADGEVVAKATACYYDLEAAPATVFPGDNENNPAVDHGNNKTFQMTIGHQNWNKNKNVWEGFTAYSSLKGNEFVGELKAEFTEGGEMMLKNAAGKYIVLTKETWGTLSGELEGAKGYKFAALTKKDFDKAVADGKILASTFRITEPSTETGEPLEVVALGEAENYELEVAVVDGTAYLTVAEEGEEGVADYTATEGEEKTTDNTWVRFGGNNLTDYSVFYDKVLNITRVKSGVAPQVASPACGGDFVVAGQIALDQPEGQWLYNGEAFVNRESGNEIVIANLRNTNKENVYTDGEYNYTIVSVGTPGDNKFKGYAAYDATSLITKTFCIGTPLVALNETVYMALGKNNQIVWTKDAAEAIEFRFTQVATDNLTLVKHFTTYAGLDKDGNVVAKEDTLNLYRYNITDLNGNALVFNSINNRYEMKASAAAITFVLKSKGGNLYNILREDDDNETAAFAVKNGDDKFLTVDNGFCVAMDKIYGAHNANELTGDVSVYETVQNDLFVINDAISNLYRSVGTTEALDTIKIFRNVDNNYVMYETGKLLAEANGDAIEGFLGIQNFLDPKYSEKNAAMYADTAAGFGTWRPQFMLALDAQIVPAGKYCPDHGFNSGCKDEHLVDVDGYTEGRYLVTLVDSAAHRADCKFQELGGTTYYRLGFVQAKHMGDSLIIAAAKPTAADTINLKNNTINKTCTFAFRYVDAKSDAFRIETLYTPTVYYTEDDPANNKYVGDVKVDAQPGWIKYHNGIPVVTSNVSDAEVFDLEVLEGVIPTDNEEVAVSEISVVATNGAVIVKGAAGKTVAISNILGQTITNTVVASDNATIAVPAGIVVVAVEGEEAVKVVVK